MQGDDDLSGGSDCEMDAVEGDEAPFEEMDVEQGEDMNVHTLSPLDAQHPDLLHELRQSGRVSSDRWAQGGLAVMVTYTAVKYNARARTTVLQCIGRAGGGESVAIFATGWLPHLTIEAPPGWRTEHSHQLEILLEVAVAHCCVADAPCSRSTFGCRRRSRHGCSRRPRASA
jgi:hypothetical protein